MKKIILLLSLLIQMQSVFSSEDSIEVRLNQQLDLAISSANYLYFSTSPNAIEKHLADAIKNNQFNMEHLKTLNRIESFGRVSVIGFGGYALNFSIAEALDPKYSMKLGPYVMLYQQNLASDLRDIHLFYRAMTFPGFNQKTWANGYFSQRAGDVVFRLSKYARDRIYAAGVSSIGSATVYSLLKATNLEAVQSEAIIEERHSYLKSEASRIAYYYSQVMLLDSAAENRLARVLLNHIEHSLWRYQTQNEEIEVSMSELFAEAKIEDRKVENYNVMISLSRVFLNEVDSSRDDKISVQKKFEILRKMDKLTSVLSVGSYHEDAYQVFKQKLEDLELVAETLGLNP